MEHRWSPRIEASLDVSVFHKHRLLGRFSTLDISLDGMFIKMDPVGLARNDVIELRLGRGSDTHGVRGMVIHVSRRGIGIMLDRTNADYFNAIKGLFRRPQPSSSPPSPGIEGKGVEGVAALAPPSIHPIRGHTEPR